MDIATPTRAANYTSRLARVRSLLDEHGWAGALILNSSDIRYLTGLKSSNAVLVVTHDAAHVATDFRYVAEASAIGGLTVHDLEQTLYRKLGESLGAWVGSGAIAYEPTELTHKSFLQMTERLSDNVLLRAVESIVGSLREVKDSVELAAIRRAAAILDDAYSMVAEQGLVGKSERDVVWAIERTMREAGADGLAFDLIVASGHNGAFPHHSPTSDSIERGTLVTIDIGCLFDGYCSDCTRTFSTGDLPSQLEEIYNVTLGAQTAALAAVQPGAVCKDIDAVARDYIADAGFGDYFGHGLGHGVGIDVHEGPRLNRLSQTRLEPGMVVTVEPGIYLPDVGGVRIEDLVIVTESGCEILTGYTKELVVVDE